MEKPSERIRRMRREAGLTQRELGRRVGVCKQQIMRYEVDGVENMRVRRLVAICRELGCTADELLAGWDEER